jgi:ribosomal protein S25
VATFGRGAGAGGVARWPHKLALRSPHPQLNGSLARAAIRELITKGLIKPVAEHAQQKIYTRAVGA